MFLTVATKINQNDVIGQVISLPSQNCTYKVKITETSVVIKADIISFRGRLHCRMCHVTLRCNFLLS